MKLIFKLLKNALRNMFKMQRIGSWRAIFQTQNLTLSLHLYGTSLFAKNNLTLLDYTILRDKIVVKMPHHKTDCLKTINLQLCEDCWQFTLKYQGKTFCNKIQSNPKGIPFQNKNYNVDELISDCCLDEELKLIPDGGWRSPGSWRVVFLPLFLYFY